MCQCGAGRKPKPNLPPRVPGVEDLSNLVYQSVPASGHEQRDQNLVRPGVVCDQCLAWCRGAEELVAEVLGETDSAVAHLLAGQACDPDHA
jgi:hypothetical protein